MTICYAIYGSLGINLGGWNVFCDLILTFIPGLYFLLSIWLSGETGKQTIFFLSIFKPPVTGNKQHQIAWIYTNWLIGNQLGNAGQSTCCVLIEDSLLRYLNNITTYLIYNRASLFEASN